MQMPERKPLAHWPLSDQAKLRQWQLTAALVTAFCGAGMFLMSVLRVLLGVHAHMAAWIIDAALGLAVIGLAVGIRLPRRWCLIATFIPLVAFAMSQIARWALAGHIDSVYMLVVPTIAILTNCWTLRTWSGVQKRLGAKDAEA
jgi:hypothetical protein